MKNIIYCVLFCFGLISTSHIYGQTIDKNDLEDKIAQLIITKEIQSGSIIEFNSLSNYKIS